MHRGPSTSIEPLGIEINDKPVFVRLNSAAFSNSDDFSDEGTMHNHRACPEKGRSYAYPS